MYIAHTPNDVLDGLGVGEQLEGVFRRAPLSHLGAVLAKDGDSAHEADLLEAVAEKK